MHDVYDGYMMGINTLICMQTIKICGVNSSKQRPRQGQWNPCFAAHAPRDRRTRGTGWPPVAGSLAGGLFDFTFIRLFSKIKIFSKMAWISREANILNVRNDDQD